MQVFLSLPKEVENFFEHHGFKCDGYLNFDRFIKKTNDGFFELIDFDDLPQRVKDTYNLCHPGNDIKIIL